MPELPCLTGQLAHHLALAHKRSQLGDLRADVCVQPHEFQRRHGTDALHQGARCLQADAELVAFPAGGDVGVAVDIDVRIQAQGNACLHAHLLRDFCDDVHLHFRLNIERTNARSHRKLDLVITLAHAGKNDFFRRHSRLQGQLQLAQRNHIRAGAELGEPFENGGIAVGFVGIANEMLMPGKSLLHALEIRFDRRHAVHIKRRAILPGKPDDRLVFKIKLTVAIGERLHVHSCCICISVLWIDKRFVQCRWFTGLPASCRKNASTN